MVERVWMRIALARKETTLLARLVGTGFYAYRCRRIDMPLVDLWRTMSNEKRKQQILFRICVF